MSDQRFIGMRFWHLFTIKQTWHNLYYWAFVLFFCGFLFFPTSKLHNNFFYATLLIPSFFIYFWIFRSGAKNILFSLVLIFLLYLLITNFWGFGVTGKKVGKQIKYTIYILSFMSVSIFFHAYYRDRMDRLLIILAFVSAVIFLSNILIWYHKFPFPTKRLWNPLGRMDNAILASCFSGFIVLVTIDALQRFRSTGMKLALIICLGINLLFIILTQSRTAFVALIPAAAILIVFSPIQRRTIIMSAVGLLSFLLVFKDAILASLNRNSHRFAIWMAMIQDTVPYIYFGRGFFSNTSIVIDGQTYSHVHNAYLATLRDGGLIGLFILMAIIGASLISAWKQKCTSGNALNLALIIFAATAVLFDIDRLVDNPEEMWVYFWYPIFRVIAEDLSTQDQGRMVPRR